MPNRISPEYKLRTVWEEVCRVQHQDVYIANRPHVECFLRSATGRFIIDHVQNFCWTLDRYFGKTRRIASRGVLAVEAAGAPRIVLDITNTRRSDMRTGIQRACLRLADEGRAANAFFAVELFKGKLFTQDALEVVLRAGDIYVVLDMFWEPFDEYIAFIKAARARGVLVATCFYDVIPALHPEVCQTSFEPFFTRCLRGICESSDILFAISRATLDDLTEVLSRLDDPTLLQRETFYFHLGADYGTPAVIPAAGAERLSAAATANTMFLSVGTMEPKKGYHLTLDAFERLWAAGHAVNLVIIGKYGWCANALRARIAAHPERDKRLFWFEDASDAVLADAYRKCHAFIQASVAEGFGIPVVEAAKHRVPIIASDIDVFKEIAGDNLIYFRSEDTASLASTILAVVAQRPAVQEWPVLSWGQSLAELHVRLLAAAARVQTKRSDATGQPQAVAPPLEGRPASSLRSGADAIPS